MANFFLGRNVALVVAEGGEALKEIVGLWVRECVWPLDLVCEPSESAHALYILVHAVFACVLRGLRVSAYFQHLRAQVRYCVTLCVRVCVCVVFRQIDARTVSKSNIVQIQRSIDGNISCPGIQHPCSSTGINWSSTIAYTPCITWIQQWFGVMNATAGSYTVHKPAAMARALAFHPDAASLACLSPYSKDSCSYPIISRHGTFYTQFQIFLSIWYFFWLLSILGLECHPDWGYFLCIPWRPHWV